MHPSPAAAPGQQPQQAQQPSAPQAPALYLEQVTKSYGTGSARVIALDAVSLRLERGSFTAVMGPSGSGKSTFLHCAAGLDTPDSGRVLLGGTDLTGLGRDALTRLRRDRVGFVFQAYNLLPQLTVAQNITLPLLLAGRPAEPAAVARTVAGVGLTGMEHRLPGQLSGGQAQRVAIARSLVSAPDVLFADEPTGALDSRTGREVLDLLRRAAAEVGQTVVVVTHDPVVAAQADRVLLLADGRLVGMLEGADADEVAARTAHLGRW